MTDSALNVKRFTYRVSCDKLLTMDKLVTEQTAETATDRWPIEVRELAYQLWSFATGRNAAKVAALLAEQNHAVPERTVQRWAASGEWARRSSDDLGRIAPDIRQQTIAELIYGGLEAARGLRAVVVGDEQADKVRVTAYVAMLDRAGFSPVGSNAPELPRVSVAQTAEDYRAMTPEQRLAAERRLKESGNALPAKTGKRRR